MATKPRRKAAGAARQRKKPPRPIQDNGIWDMLKSMAGVVEGPSDLSAEHDHYLYGTAKKIDS